MMAIEDEFEMEIETIWVKSLLFRTLNYIETCRIYFNTHSWFSFHYGRIWLITNSVNN
jgi:hypothetical protein